MPNLESLMCRHISEFIKTIGSREGPFDVAVACRALEADIICAFTFIWTLTSALLNIFEAEFSFGKTIGAIRAWNKGQILDTISKNDEKASLMPLLTHYPLLYKFWTLWEYLKCQIQETEATSYLQGLEQFDKWSYEAWGSNFDIQKPIKSPFPNLIRSMVAAGLAPQTALSEAKENMGPGTDTTSGSLAHILYALSHNPQYQELLYNDISREEFTADMSRLENIPRLKACVKEGVRWAGTAAAMLPCIVPAGGVELHGQVIPEGTVLTSSPTWYLRDAEAFPEPDLFNPYRWIDETGRLTENKLRDQFYIPFSKGTNVCIGLHFSYYEIYVSVAKVIENFLILPQDAPECVPVERQAVRDWNLVQLPRRKEWVAAVLLDPLLIKLVPR
ncbi:cytochrome P450 [Pochonia chlamydosporia 170]|uniref:Cytochrome P450 n=1 Tax=Pochonia chlamydosporia 170 TaxID=1380566 RepID=A0A179F279_METCM|nr:cytochrome P450 [Pochonia chlamydosporia 170]OAQ59223.1 cytochrome P450 [Pochonia chlamydosporia 170]